MKREQLKELLLQSLETELGGVEIYQTALRAAVHPDLREEWEKYLEQTKHHVEVLTGVFASLGLDPQEQSPGRQVVGGLGKALVQAMQTAQQAGPAEAAQIVACECVVLAETKDHLDWELIGACADKLGGKDGKALKAAYDEIEDQEDEHLYHTKGWCRELWIKSLGMRAVLPPPEEEKHVKTAIGAARAEQDRESML